MHPVLDAFLAQTADGPQSGNPIMQLVPFLAIAVVFYFIFFRPQQRQQKLHRTFLEGLKRGDQVVTQGGIIGEVVSVEDKVVTVNVGGGTKIRMLKAQVAGQWKEPVPGEAKPEKK
jgi:preprotein translocase subunit YajC